MGMDYRYSGSSSYPRFDREITEVAKVFGGELSSNLKKRKDTESERASGLGYWFGYMSSDNSKLPRFIFPEGTNELLVTWFNDIYGDHHIYTPRETKNIWELVKEHPEIENISSQIWNELEKNC